MDCLKIGKDHHKTNKRREKTDPKESLQKKGKRLSKFFEERSDRVGSNRYLEDPEIAFSVAAEDDEEENEIDDNMSVMVDLGDTSKDFGSRRK